MFRLTIEIDTVFLMAVGWTVQMQRDNGELVMLNYGPLKRVQTPEIALDLAMHAAEVWLDEHGWQLHLPLA